jgi:hypothetical protein
VSAAGDGGVGCRCQHACYMVLGGVMLPTSRVAAVAAALHEWACSVWLVKEGQGIGWDCIQSLRACCKCDASCQRTAGYKAVPRLRAAV